MLSPTKNTKKPRRVSFTLPDSPNSIESHPKPQPTPILKPTLNTTKDKTSSRINGNTSSFHDNKSVPADNLANAFTHTVTNTPHGLVIDGVLQPRGSAVRSELHNTQPQPQPQPQPQLQPQPQSFSNFAYNTSIPPNFQNNSHPQQASMSTVAAGVMPDPNAVHYQPPVPDTTNGPYQYTYMPRSDLPGPQYMMANGMAAAGGMPFNVPGAFPYQQPQPGMATAPIPMVSPGCQPPFAQAHPMQAPGINFQPGPMPPMGCAPPVAGPAFMTPGISQPTPPITPPGAYFGGGGSGSAGVELGKTRAEIEAETQYNALHNQMNEPQGIKPADDDPSRMYWCRELDGQWISRSRFSLDRMGHFRWYITENGVFYAKMLVE